MMKNIFPEETTVSLSDPDRILIWNGVGTAYRFARDQYERDPAYDYRFSVVQERANDRWRSMKNLYRPHPGYDGRAGARTQTMSFDIRFKESGAELASTLHTSLGDGAGKSDREFRAQELDIVLVGQPFLTRFMYDHLAITQTYRYEEGKLNETVLLYKKGANGEKKPFMKIEEEAHIFVHKKLPAPPTIFGA